MHVDVACAGGSEWVDSKWVDSKGVGYMSLAGETRGGRGGCREGEAVGAVRSRESGG
jgi:hypothetical protein